MAARGPVAGAGQAHVAEPIGTWQPDGGVVAVPEDGAAIVGNDLRKLVVSIGLTGEHRVRRGEGIGVMGENVGERGRKGWSQGPSRCSGDVRLSLN